MYGSCSAISDVFSFGIVVLEIVRGSRSHLWDSEDSSITFHEHAWKLWSEGKALDLVDDSLADAFLADEALRCIQVGLLCIQKQPCDRPTMPSVLKMLEGDEPGLRQDSVHSNENQDGVDDSCATFELDDTLEREKNPGTILLMFLH